MADTVAKEPIAWRFVDASEERVRCKAKRGPRSRIQCEVYEGHKDAHCGRGRTGRWFSW